LKRLSTISAAHSSNNDDMTGDDCMRESKDGKSDMDLMMMSKRGAGRAIKVSIAILEGNVVIESKQSSDEWL
jgi:hypothetical protein